MHGSRRPRPTCPETDLVFNAARARTARRGAHCPVCGQWKKRGALICPTCSGGCDQAMRNRLAAGIEEYIEAVCELRTARRARTLGLTLLRPETEE